MSGVQRGLVPPDFLNFYYLNFLKFYYYLGSGLSWIFVVEQQGIPTRDPAHVPCTERQILSHWTTREVPPPDFRLGPRHPGFHILASRDKRQIKGWGRREGFYW